MIRSSGIEPAFRDVYERICTKYPSAREYTQPVSLTCAVIPREHVSARFHYLVEDVAFRDEVARIIETTPRLNGVRTNHKGDDAVLILCPVQ